MSFVNNYSPDFQNERLVQHNLKMSEEVPKGFESKSEFSKALTYILRHGARRAKLCILPGGYIEMQALLRHFGGRCTEKDIRRAVAQDEKKRFDIRTDPATGKVQIRANQGHTFQVDDDGSLLAEVLPESGFSEVTHGTTSSAWLTIKKQGLCRMKRNHIHFIAGRADTTHVMLPGFRNASVVLIIVDLRKAVLDGIKFFRSKNGVILSPGDENGFISTEYFKQVIDAHTNENLWLAERSAADRECDASSLRKVGSELALLEVTHGTTMSKWRNGCKKNGLTRTAGNEWIVFRRGGVSAGGDLHSDGSQQTTVWVSVDLRKAMRDGIDFYSASNGAVMSKGNAEGIIPPKYFKRAIDSRTNAVLWPTSKK